MLNSHLTPSPSFNRDHNILPLSEVAVCFPCFRGWRFKAARLGEQNQSILLFWFKHAKEGGARMNVLSRLSGTRLVDDAANPFLV